MSDDYDAGAGAAKRFFISYRRSAEDDRALAAFLKTGLEQAGHEVFIDVGMPVGTDWAEEIGRRITWCDHLVVLLSEQSIDSEMVQGEVRMAHQARRADGRPAILPVRVNYDGRLDYELDSYLSRLQYASWKGQSDSATVLDALLRAAAGRALQEAPAPAFDGENGTVDLSRPQPVSDPRALLRAPGGTIRIDDPFYITRQADGMIEATAAGEGETIVIKAARQMGKSSLLVRYLAACREAGKRIVYLDFQSFTDADLADYPILLQRIAAQILRRLEMDAPDAAPIESQIDFDNFIEDHVLKQAGGPVTFGFDEVDRLLGRPYQGDFFAMLRTWHNRRADPFGAWAEVDIALVIATEPYLLIETGDQSPFNVAVPIELDSLGRDGIDDLNGRYGSPLGAGQIDQLHELLAGHPYLTRLAFFRLVGEGRAFDDIARQADQTDGPFGDHLRARFMLLQKQPQLLAALKKLIRDGTQPDADTYFRLHGAGLACRRGDRIEPANMLYARFFKQVR